MFVVVNQILCVQQRKWFISRETQIIQQNVKKTSNNGSLEIA